MRRILYFFALAIMSVAGGKADIFLTLDQPDQSGMPGDTLQFFGSVSNTGTDTVFFNADDLNFTGGPSFATNDLFVVNVPISLDGGLSSGDIELFDVTLSSPFTDPLGLYGGSYTLTGGVDGGSQDVLATTDFSVTAQQPVSATPEPSYLGLVSVGCLALLAAKRIRRQCATGREISKHTPGGQTAGVNTII